MHSDPDASPFNALPQGVILLAAAIFGVEMLFVLSKSGLIGGTRGGEDWRIFAFQRFAFSGDIFKWMIETGRWSPEHLLRFVSYAFVHFTFTHMIFVVVFVLALGKMVGEAFSSMAVLVIFFASTIVGALAYGLILNDPRPLVGGYAGAYGLIGAYTLILWIGYGAVGANQYRAFSLIGMLLAIQLIFGLFFEVGNDWLAEVAGFITGFGTATLLIPGSVSRLVEKMRNR